MEVVQYGLLFFYAFIEIGFYISNNWESLTATTIAATIGVILGKRVGSRIALNYALRLMGINHKSTLERKVEWLVEQERSRGNTWNAPISKPYKLDFRTNLLKSFTLSPMAQFTARFTKLRTYGRNKKMSFLKSNLSKKLIVATVTILLAALNKKFELGMSDETILVIAGVAATYVAGQSHVDAKKEQAKPFVLGGSNEPDYSKADNTSE